MIDVKFEFDDDNLKRAVQDAFDDYVDNEGVDYECPGCGSSIVIKTGENVCPDCGFVINVEKGELQL